MYGTKVNTAKTKIPVFFHTGTKDNLCPAAQVFMSFYKDTYAVKVYANTVNGYHF